MTLLAGIGIVVLYLAGAAVSGRASISARRPLLDGLAPPTPYRWVTRPGPGHQQQAAGLDPLHARAHPQRVPARRLLDQRRADQPGPERGAVPARPADRGGGGGRPRRPATLGPVPPGW